MGAAFVVRWLLRGFSFDRTDVLVLGMFVLVLVVTAIVRRWTAEDPTGGGSAAPRPGVDRDGEDKHPVDDEDSSRADPPRGSGS